MVFQFYALYPALTVGENIAFPLHCEQLGAAEIDSAGRPRWRDILHLDRCARPHAGPDLARARSSASPSRRAIVRDPNCFLFDEPLSRLDVELRQSDARPDQGGAAGPLQGHGHRHPRPARGADHGRPHRHHARRHRSSRSASPHEIFAKPANLFVASFIGTPQMNLIDAHSRATATARRTWPSTEQDRRSRASIPRSQA